MTTRDKLDALAANLWWSWHPEARDLFRRLNPDAYRAAGNSPAAALREAHEAELHDDGFAADVDRIYRAFEADLARDPFDPDAPRTAYFCMEYGLHESIPLYSGGLGILAGDHAKTASDLGLPFTAVGLFLRDGYFEQRFRPDGYQRDEHHTLDPGLHPLTLVTDDDGAVLTVTVHLGTTPVEVQAWRIDLGRTTMYLLDLDVEGNPEHVRELTWRLYQGGHEGRIQQEIVLGVGGVRLLRALGHEPEVFHANEGHCAFLMLELLRERLDAGLARPDAEAEVRAQCVFTTHTPVPAGHDHFEPGLFNTAMAGLRQQLGFSEDDLLAYGRVDPGDAAARFTMTVLGLKLARGANGVSKLNGKVARQQWKGLYPDRTQPEVPIGHITNGVHLPTWMALEARRFLAKRLGADWWTRRHDEATFAPLADVPAAELWGYRARLRQRLIDFVLDHTAHQTLPQQPELDAETLTVGFARRFATYKRAPLIFTDLERARALFADADRPIQLLYAGKAHPDDEGGKAFIQRIFELSQQDGFRGHVVFLENYNMKVGRMLVSGCDVWLNNPRRPLEASGTSGQKVTLHGGLNLSVLDGWWPEGYDGANGWAIGPEPTGVLDMEKDVAAEDAQDAAALYEQLETSVIPAFYDRDADGLPRAWIERMRHAMTTLPAAFSAQRMLIDYLQTMYHAPARV